MTNRIQKTLSFSAWEEEALNDLSAKCNLSASAIVRALIKQAETKVKNRLDLENCITAHNVHDVNLPLQEIYQWMIDFFEHKIKKEFPISWKRHGEKWHARLASALEILFDGFLGKVEIVK